ncbi:MAG TPA: hypothetical protein VFE47_12210 [Tepidisphaeraceae bacterium]|jgi:hypothetical protein|nr:hypothetical protein [Tepidisphaeraceae bacterium]
MPASAPPPPLGADDMLAQLAGDEIDRLLAEAETDAPPKIAPAPKPPPPADPAEPVVAAITEDPPASAAAAEPVEPFAAVAEEKSSEPAPPPPAEPSAVASESPAPAVDAQAAPPAAPQPAAPATEPAATEAASAPELKSAILQLDPADDIRPPSLLTRILDLILSPFDAIPDGLLNAIGKVGMVTLVNALALILYVVVVRHHLHHK